MKVNRHNKRGEGVRGEPPRPRILHSEGAGGGGEGGGGGAVGVQGSYRALCICTFFDIEAVFWGGGRCPRRTGSHHGYSICVPPIDKCFFNYKHTKIKILDTRSGPHTPDDADPAGQQAGLK